MSNIISRVALAAAGVLAASLFTACGSGPSQVGAAAIVGDTVVPLDSVQQQIDAVLAREPAARQAKQQRKLDVVSRQILTLRVQHELIRQVADRRGLHVDEQQVAARLSQAGGAERAAKGTVLDAAGLTSRTRDESLLAALARQQLPHLAVTFDYVIANDPNDARELARKLAAQPDRADTIIRQAVAQGSTGQAGRRIAGAADTQDAAATPLFGIPAGTVAAFPLSQASSRWLVALVRQRDTDASVPQAQAAAVARLDPRLLTQIGVRLLGPYSAKAGIRINPRYGVWDPLGMQVVPSTGEAIGLRLPAREGVRQ